jgi:hypothetical protein
MLCRKFCSFFNIIEFFILPLLEPKDAKEFGYRLLSSQLASFLSVAAAATARSFAEVLVPSVPPSVATVAAATATSFAAAVAAFDSNLTPFAGPTLALFSDVTLSLSFGAILAPFLAVALALSVTFAVAIFIQKLYFFFLYFYY